MKNLLSLFFLVLVMFLVGCGHTPKNNGTVAATVDGTEIYLKDADQFVKYELYEALQRIHVLRKAAIAELVNERLIELEAKALDISKEVLIRREIDEKITDASVDVFIREHKLDSVGMPDISNGYRIVFPNTAEGRSLAKAEYARYLKSQLVESLKKKYPSQIMLEPPASPTMNTEDLPVVYYRGKQDSEVTMVIVSDFNCDNCRTAFPLFEKLYRKYGGRVRFGYTHFAPEVSLAAMAAGAANDQDKFWDYHQEVLSAKNHHTSDTAYYTGIAGKLNLDMNRFKAALSDGGIRQEIQQNIDLLKARKVYATPTVVINGRVILDVFDEARLEEVLEQELTK
ncbi:MAG TPA: thioredoxin domain-containing protein [Chitinophagaceae bacterium]|nr:thioredoxin domain-containing protein [Chitinophagaceae bacterium]